MKCRIVHGIAVAPLVAALAAILANAPGTAYGQPRTQPLEEDRPGIWAKVANERAKGNARKGMGLASEDDERCGSIDVGNVDTGGSGGRGRAPRENIVVITGDVVNAPGRCK